MKNFILFSAILFTVHFSYAQCTLEVSSSVTNASCFGKKDGKISLNLTGGILPYSMTWSNGKSKPINDSLFCGNYTVWVFDDTGCMVVHQATVSQPDELKITSITPTEITCPGFTGGLEIVTSGGNGFTNLGSGTINISGTTTNGIPVNNTSTVANGQISGGTGFIDSGMQSGEYDITITDDIGCVSIKVDEIIWFIEPTEVEIRKIVTPLKCSDIKIGTIDINLIGGGSYISAFASFTLEGGYDRKSIQGFVVDVHYDRTTVSEFIGLSGGIYNFTAIDDKGCISSSTIEVPAPPAISLTPSIIRPTCQDRTDGSIEIQASGGNGFSSGNGTLTSNDSFFDVFFDLSGNTNIPNLGEDNYIFRAIDDKGCSSSVPIEMVSMSLISYPISTNASCSNTSDGGIMLTVSSENGMSATGTGVLTNSFGNIVNSFTGSSTSVFGLLADIYDLVITDDLGCIFNSTIPVNSPPPLSISLYKTDIICFGDNTGAAEAIASGGTPPYTFLWSNNSNSSFIFPIAAGSYGITVSDANGCTSFAEVTINESPALETNILKVDLKCYGDNDGLIDLTVDGGVPPYSYLWNNGAITQDIENLVKGFYSVKVKDSKNCTKNTSAEIIEPDNLFVAAYKIDLKCKNGNDGAIDLVVSGGTPSYTYEWSNGASSQDLSSLSKGSYSATIRDANNCVKLVDVIITEPNGLSVTSVSIHNNCFGGKDGSVELNVSGGQPPYFFDWMNGSTTKDLINLEAGNYSVTISDFNGCEESLTIEITEPDQLVATAEKVNPVCFQESSGSISISTQGGTPPYNYNWSNGINNGSGFLGGLAAGNYSVIVTDALDCSVNLDISLFEPSELLGIPIITSVACKNGMDGEIELEVSGGVGPYAYNWSNGKTTKQIDSLTANLYSVEITDAHLCMIFLNILVDEPLTELSLAHIRKHVSCKGGNDGFISVDVSGGSPPYYYFWSTGATTDKIDNLEANEYNLVVNDEYSCTLEVNFTVTEPDPLPIFATDSVKNSCFGNDGYIHLLSSGGVPPHFYLWSNGETDSNLDSLIQGNYQIKITDYCGWYYENNYTILGVSKPEISQSGDTLFSTIASGYQWLLEDQIIVGATNQILLPIKTGLYSVIAYDSTDCYSLSENHIFNLNSSPQFNHTIPSQIYPNPFNQFTIIKFNENITSANLVVFDMLGQEVRTISNINSPHIYFERDDLKAGNYFFKLFNGNGMPAFGKLIINDK